MNIDLTPQDMNSALCAWREYAKDREITPAELHEIFTEGIVAIAERRAETDPLRAKVMIGSRPVED